MSTIYASFPTFFAGFRVSQQGASVSQLPAALRRPQKKHALDFVSMYLRCFVMLSDFSVPCYFFPNMADLIK